MTCNKLFFIISINAVASNEFLSFVMKNTIVQFLQRKNPTEIQKKNSDVFIDLHQDSGIISNQQQPHFHKRLYSILNDESQQASCEVGNKKLNSSVTYTPLEKQVVTIRQTHADCILMVECGYRMRFFGNDAVIAARILKIYAHQSHNFMVASVPTFRASIHCQRLLNAGYKVAIVRQMESAIQRKLNPKASSSRNTFERAVVGIFTKGTLIDSADPAFEGLNNNVNSSNDHNDEEGSEEDVEEEENATHNHNSLDLAFDDPWIAAISESHVISPQSSSSALLSLHQQRKMISIAVINILANQLFVTECAVEPQAVEEWLDFLQPSEVVIEDGLSTEIKDEIMKRVNDGASSSSLYPTTGQHRIIQRVSTYTLDSNPIPITSDQQQSMDSTIWNMRSIQLLYAYLKPFQLSQAIFEANLELLHTKDNTKQVVATTQSEPELSFRLDGTTLRDLEIVPSNSSPSVTSCLISFLDHCHATYGKRMLKSWIINPLKQLSSILVRQEAIEWLLQNDITASNQISTKSLVFEVMKHCPELERLLCALKFQRITPSRLLILLSYIDKLVPFFTTLQTQANQLPSLLTTWLNTVDIETLEIRGKSFVSQLAQGKEMEYSLTGIFTSYFEDSHVELQDLRKERTCQYALLEAELQAIRKHVHNPDLQFFTLNYGNAKVEYLIDLPMAEDANMPTDWIRVNHTKARVRYHTPKVVTIQERLQQIVENSKAHGQALWKEYCHTVSTRLYPILHAVVHCLANLDAILSLAEVSRSPHYVKPVFGSCMDVKDGRHPMLEHWLEDEHFIPNDISLGYAREGKFCQVIGGPNMGGKSSYVRMVGVISILGQIGCFVPASSAQLVVYDRIITRMGSEDHLLSGQSTFLREMLRVQDILSRATSHSLVILDELGRGTSTTDGYAIAQATLHYLITHIGCSILFITHYHQIVDSLCHNPDYATCCTNSHMKYMSTGDSQEEIVFLYKLVEEPATGSYGINVARLVGLSDKIIRRAEQISMQVQKKEEDRSKFHPQVEMPQT